MKLNIKEAVIFSMLGAIMYASKVITDVLPNIHLIGIFIVTITLVYRKKALYPIYIFVFLTGLLNGFATWWIPYLYIWTVLWAAVMILPQNIPQKIQPIVYMVVCGLHGLLYGVLYAPAQAILFGLDLKGMIAWIVAGLPFDAIHGISNFIGGLLVQPLVATLKLAKKVSGKS